jgi:hypothetical protein
VGTKDVGTKDVGIKDVGIKDVVTKDVGDRAEPGHETRQAHCHGAQAVSGAYSGAYEALLP